MSVRDCNCGCLRAWVRVFGDMSLNSRVDRHHHAIIGSHWREAMQLGAGCGNSHDQEASKRQGREEQAGTRTAKEKAGRRQNIKSTSQLRGSVGKARATTPRNSTKHAKVRGVGTPCGPGINQQFKVESISQRTWLRDDPQEQPRL